jgi:hypothetical protein
MPDSNAHRHSLGGESLDDTPTEETGAAKHADRGHGIPFGMLDKVDPAPHSTLLGVVSWPKSKPSSFVEIIGSLSGRNSS